MTIENTESRKARRVLLWIYGLAFLYFVVKLVYYVLYVGSFPDQRAHTSYLIEMTRNPSLLPDFASIPMYTVYRWNGLTEYMSQLVGEVNYLGHPSLYYLLMSQAGAVHFWADGEITVDYLRISIWNIVLTGIALAIAYRLGYKYLKSRSPVVHGLYAAAIATLPELGYVGGSVNNDNLAFLAFVIFSAGILRYREEKADLKTYLLIGVGFLLGSFSKLTTALIMLIMLVAILIMSIVRTKSLKLIANKWFLITLPCYLLFLVYEILIYRKYGGWQPSLSLIAPEYYKTTVYYVAPEYRTPMTLWQYFRRFLGGIGYSWSSLYGHSPSVNRIMNLRVLGVIFWIPVGVTLVTAVARCVRRKADCVSLPAAAAFLGTLAYHFYTGWTGFLKNGYANGMQARYYLALIVPFAFVMCEALPPLFRTKKAKTIGTVLALLLIACWLAGDAPRLAIQFGFPAY